VIYVVATLTVKPETRAEFIAAATGCIKETRKEPGNIAYDLHESVTDPAKMVFVEQWADRAALLAHFAVPASRDFVRALQPLAATATTLEIYDAARLEKL